MTGAKSCSSGTVTCEGHSQSSPPPLCPRLSRGAPLRAVTAACGSQLRAALQARCKNHWAISTSMDNLQPWDDPLWLRNPFGIALCRQNSSKLLPGESFGRAPFTFSHFHTGNSENVKEVNARKILLLKTTTKDNGKSSESKCLFSRLTPDAVAVRSPLEAQSAEPNRARKE